MPVERGEGGGLEARRVRHPRAWRRGAPSRVRREACRTPVCAGRSERRAGTGHGVRKIRVKGGEGMATTKDTPRGKKRSVSKKEIIEALQQDPIPGPHRYNAVVAAARLSEVRLVR